MPVRALVIEQRFGSAYHVLSADAPGLLPFFGAFGFSFGIAHSQGRPRCSYSLYLKRWLPLDGGKFLRDSPDLVFISAFQCRVPHRFLQSLLGFVFHLAKPILYPIVSS